MATPAVDIRHMLRQWIIVSCSQTIDANPDHHHVTGGEITRIFIGIGHVLLQWSLGYLSTNNCSHPDYVAVINIISIVILTVFASLLTSDVVYCSGAYGAFSLTLVLILITLMLL